MTDEKQPSQPEKDRIVSDVLRDWERLKRQENNIAAVMGGRDLLGEIERLREERDGWAKIAVEAQTDGVNS